MQEAQRLAYRPDIDGIRAIAVLLVVVFHFRLVPGANSGFMGVDVFFVISGFLITSIIQRQLEAKTFRLGTFWSHRVRRLAPALVCTTVLTLLAGWLWLLPADFAKLAQQTIAAQLYFANIFYWRNVNYFGLQAHDVYLLHTWSLAVEEQFYILFPLTLIAIAKWARGRVALVIGLLALVSFALNLALVGVKPEATFYLMPTRAWELLAGSLLALFVPRLRGDKPLAAQLAGAAGLLCLAITLVTYRVTIPFPGTYALLPAAAGVLLILAGSIGPNATSHVLSLRPIGYIGRISYPLYLVHWPVNVFATAALGADYGRGWRLFMLLMSALLAASIYHGVEGPSRRWLERARAGTLVRAYAASLVAAVGLSIFVLGSDGVPSRYPDRVARLAMFVRDSPPPLRECEYAVGMVLKTATMCRLGAKNEAPQWFVYGDSHAWAASGALDHWLARTGQSAVFMFVHSCPPVRDVYVLRQGPLCARFNAAALAYLEAEPTITQVLLVSTWLQAKEGILTDASGRELSVDSSVALFGRQFVATVEDLKRMGKSAYVWEPLPGASELVPQAMARSALNSTPLAIDYTRDEYLARYDFFFESLRKGRPALAGTFSPARELCGSGRCVTQIGGSPLYFDNGHLTYSLRSFWADALARQIPVRADGAAH